MFFTPNIFGGLHITDESVEVAFLSIDRGQFQFIAAEKCDRKTFKFSKEIRTLFSQAREIFSMLPIQKTLLKRVDLPDVRASKKQALAEVLLYSQGVFKKGELMLLLEGPSHVFCAFNTEIEKTLKECRSIGTSPHGLTAPARSLANFVVDICKKSSGSFLYIHHQSGLFIQVQEKKTVVLREFFFNDTEADLAARVRVVLDGIVETVIWITGPGAFDSGLISYLQAALGRSFKRQSLEKMKMPAQLAHNFALALGSAVEASKPNSDRLNFRSGPFQSRRLLWRSLWQEAYLTLHVAAVMSLGAFLTHLFIERKAVKESSQYVEMHLPRNSFFNSHLLEHACNEMTQDLKELEASTKNLPFALAYPRALGHLCEQIAKNPAIFVQKYSYIFDKKKLLIEMTYKSQQSLTGDLEIKPGLFLQKREVSCAGH